MLLVWSPCRHLRRRATMFLATMLLPSSTRRTRPPCLSTKVWLHALRLLLMSQSRVCLPMSWTITGRRPRLIRRLAVAVAVGCPVVCLALAPAAFPLLAAVLLLALFLVFRLCPVALVLLAQPAAPFFLALVLRDSRLLGWPMPNGISLVLVVLVRLRRLPSPPGLRLVALVGTVLGTPMPLEPPCFLRRCLARGSLRPTSAVC